EPSDLILRGIGELVTNDPRRVEAGLLGIVNHAAIAIRSGRVDWAGPLEDLPDEYFDLPDLDCAGRAVLPGFVDSHTHLVFAGERGEEFTRRLAGESYETILAAGGGIQATVRATRRAVREAAAVGLVESARLRAERMLTHGTTTVEIKSGYGLDVPTELRMLEAASAIGKLVPIDTVGTVLGAHVVPPEFAGDRESYIRLVEEEMLPLLAPLARYCDVFCDRGAFTVPEARHILEAGKHFGLKPRVHAEQLVATGAALLAAEVGAVSADHLDHIDEEGAAALAAAGTVATLLPAASFSMRTPQAPARLLWDAGVTVALATDCNPGTSYVESMQFVIAVAALETGLSPAEAVWAATRGGALALEEPDKGWIGAGTAADLVILDAPSSVHIPYRPGANLVWKVIKDGAVVVERPSPLQGKG
ncbi:MAG: imidazolonepropionase, partial [Acidimicrobiia bacterium]|nr:imidazolonepropionase [Acidimicrobiia bacterium]